MQTINTIIFDLDGTLIDSSVTNINAFHYALAPFGITLTHQEIDAMRSLTSNELFQDRLTAAEAKQALSRLWDYSRQSAKETILFPGINSLLEAIAAKDITMGVWTGRDRTSTIDIIQHHHIAHYFKAIVGGCEVSKNKPDPEGLYRLISKLQRDTNNMIHVGDHEHDIVGANTAGVTSIYAKWHKQPLECLTQAHYSFDTIIAFQTWLNL